MKSQSSSDRGAMADINVTPLVDVTLVLLIIFMVAAPIIQQGVDVNLPRVVATELPLKTELLVVSINRSGSIFVGTEPVALPALAERLRVLNTVRVSKDAYLRADEGVAYGTVVRVMAEMKKAGIERLGMVTEPPEGI
jgi:biopolymer transport protein TolR